jgi:hypothetical protein
MRGKTWCGDSVFWRVKNMPRISTLFFLPPCAGMRGVMTTKEKAKNRDRIGGLTPVWSRCFAFGGCLQSLWRHTGREPGWRSGHRYKRCSYAVPCGRVCVGDPKLQWTRRLLFRRGGVGGPGSPKEGDRSFAGTTGHNVAIRADESTDGFVAGCS